MLSIILEALKKLLSPLSIYMVVIALTLCGIVFMQHSALEQQKKDMKLLRSEIVAMQVYNEAKEQQEKIVVKYLKDRDTIITNQETVREVIRKIPDTSSCMPFEDENTLKAAQTLRDYQEGKNASK